MRDEKRDGDEKKDEQCKYVTVVFFGHVVFELIKYVFSEQFFR